MSAGVEGRVLVGFVAALTLLGGCAGPRLADSVYHSSKGYRVTVPGPDWEIVDSSRADLELRHRNGEAGMLALATCDAAVRQRGAQTLVRALLAGLRDRRVLVRGEMSVNGLPAARTVVEARGAAGGPELRIESLTLTGERCVYDMIFAAPPAGFDARRGDFARFVASFAME